MEFASLVFVPETSLPGMWSDYIDATTEDGLWGGTGDLAGTECDLNGVRCTWDELRALLDDGGEPPEIISVAVTKGRDQAWHGAVDGLRINDIVYDFEEHGVLETAPSS